MQKALFRSPGLFSSVNVWRAIGPAAKTQVHEVAARILEEAESDPRAHLLVGLRWPEPGEAVLPRGKDLWDFPSTQCDLLVQVAADTREDLLWGLHRTEAIGRGVVELSEELLGDRIGPGREAFGYRDGLNAPDADEVKEVARVRGGREEGGSWLLYLRFQQDLEKFSRLPARDQDNVIGRTRAGELLPDPPTNAHVALAMTYRPGGQRTFVRRGFPFRQLGTEGLAFVAASRDTQSFAKALDVMLGSEGVRDALLPYSRAVSGGVYFVPPSARWLRAHHEELLR